MARNLLSTLEHKVHSIQECSAVRDEDQERQQMTLTLKSSAVLAPTSTSLNNVNDIDDASVMVDNVMSEDVVGNDNEMTSRERQVSFGETYVRVTTPEPEGNAFFWLDDGGACD